MKVALFQPEYPSSGAVAGALSCLQWMQDNLNELKSGGQDLVLLPEYANAPGISDRKTLRQFAVGQGLEFVRFVADTAKRLKCLIVLGVLAQSQSRWFNRTLVFDGNGETVFTYEKVHLTDVEQRDLMLTPGAMPKVFKHAGVCIGFATCFDQYFPEHFEALAAQRADLVLCPSYQRSESAERIILLARARALDAGAYLIRASYAMGTPGSGGHSLVADPTGAVQADAEEKAAVLMAEIDLRNKFFKPASHAESVVEHRALIESHRVPTAYRAQVERRERIVKTPFPRICAHRGLSVACPQNTLPAFAAAIAVGADEIEFDLRMTRDGVAVACHDETVEHTTDGVGKINEMIWEEIRKLDAGVKCARHDAANRLNPDAMPNECWRGVRIPRFEELLELVDGRVGLNIHVKETGPEDRLVKIVCDMLRKQNLSDIAYIAGNDASVLQAALNYAPEVSRACLRRQGCDVSRQIELALACSARRIQMWGEVSAQQVKYAHDRGLICNYFWCDDPTKARELAAKGIDVILTNCANVLLAAGFRDDRKHGQDN